MPNGNAPASRPPKRSGLGAGQKAAIAIIAIVSVAVIAVSAFALAGGFSPEDASAPSSAAAGSAASQEEETADAAEDEAADADAAKEAEEADGSAEGSQSTASDSGDAAASGAAAGGAASGGSGSGSSGSGSSSGPADEAPAAITVAVSVDSSSVGSPVSLVTTVTLQPGATVYDAITQVANVNARASQYGMYVAAINGLAEKEHGGMSGWTYYVNGVYVNAACSSTVLSDGDAVSWVYVTGD